VVVDFWVPWCGPCRAIELIIKKLEAEYSGRVDVWKINADEQTDLLHSLRIYGIPTLVAFHNDEAIARHTGEALTSTLSKLFEAGISGEAPVQSGRALLRLSIGNTLFIVAFQSQFDRIFLLMGGLGVLVAFSAVYDRCPIYQAFAGRIRGWWHKDRADQPHT